MSKERIIRKGEICQSRIKGKYCGHYSLQYLVRPLELIPSALVETGKSGKRCGLTMDYSQMEECVIPGNGREDVEIKSFKD